MFVAGIFSEYGDVLRPLLMLMKVIKNSVEESDKEVERCNYELSITSDLPDISELYCFPLFIFFPNCGAGSNPYAVFIQSYQIFKGVFKQNDITPILQVC